MWGINTPPKTKRLNLDWDRCGLRRSRPHSPQMAMAALLSLSESGHQSERRLRLNLQSRAADTSLVTQEVDEGCFFRGVLATGR